MCTHTYCFPGVSVSKHITRPPAHGTEVSRFSQHFPITLPEMPLTRSSGPGDSRPVSPPPCSLQVLTKGTRFARKCGAGNKLAGDELNCFTNSPYTDPKSKLLVQRAEGHTDAARGRGLLNPWCAAPGLMPADKAGTCSHTAMSKCLHWAQGEEDERAHYRCLLFTSVHSQSP